MLIIIIILKIIGNRLLHEDNAALTTHHHLKPRLKMYGTIPPLPHCASYKCYRMT
jgi:hypothetical protein